uniref:O-antigen polymerase n=1 Tax=Rhodopseudomonas palustris (strain BisA53) TaxID=316055 RepID=Q07IH9_RHOP5
MSLTLPASGRTAPSSPISDKAAYTVAAGVATVGLFSVVVPNLADAAIIVLAIIAGGLLWQHRWQRLRPVIVLALVWMVFVALSAVWATYSGSPGNQFRSWNKHIPIALGPLLAIAFAAACRRLRWPAERLLALFLAALVVGALVQLIRNDAIGTMLELRSSNGFLGGINRNIAALICSLAIVASVSLLYYGLFERAVRSVYTIAAAIGLVFVLGALLLLLVLLQSRTGYAGTTLGLMAWLVAMAALTRHRPTTGRSRQLQLAAAFVAIAALAFAGYGAWQISGRSLIGAPAGGWLELTNLVLHGRFEQAYAVAQTAEERLQILTLAADLFHRRPWLGWGPDVWLLPRHFSPLPNLLDINQFHNGYAQFLVSFGIVGALLIGVYLVALLSVALGGSRRAAAGMSAPMVAASIGLLVLLLVENASESVLLVKCAACVAMMLTALVCMAAADEVVQGNNRGETPIGSTGYSSPCSAAASLS